jgi:hypothetical protein
MPVSLGDFIAVVGVVTDYLTWDELEPQLASQD